MFTDNVSYEQLWIAFAVLAVINFILFCIIGVLMRRQGKLENLVHSFISDPDFFDTIMEDLRLERKSREREWRRERGIMDVPSMVERALRDDPPVPLGYDSANKAFNKKLARTDPGVDEDPLQALGRMIGQKDPYRG